MYNLLRNEMMKYMLINFIIMILIVNLSFAQDLDDYLQLAESNNPGLESIHLEYLASKKKIGRVGSLNEPTISFGYFVSPIETRLGAQRAKISVSQMFPWFGTLDIKESIETEKSRSIYERYVDEKNRLFLDVKSAYYKILELGERIKLQNELLEVFESYKAFALSKYSNEKGTMVDILRVDILIDNMKTEIEIAKNKIEPLESEFNKLLNRENKMGVDVFGFDSINPDILNFYGADSLLEFNPLIRSIEYKIKSAQADEELAENEGNPVIGIGLDYAFISERIDASPEGNGTDVIMPMVTFSLPIYRGKINARKDEAHLISQSLMSRKEDIKNTLLSKYELARYEIKKSIKMNELYKLQIRKTKQSIDLLYSEYSTSGKDFNEVLSMQKSLLGYKIEQLSTMKDYYTSLAKLEYLTSNSK